MSSIAWAFAESKVPAPERAEVFDAAAWMRAQLDVLGRPEDAPPAADGIVGLSEQLAFRLAMQGRELRQEAHLRETEQQRLQQLAKENDETEKELDRMKRIAAKANAKLRLANALEEARAGPWRKLATRTSRTRTRTREPEHAWAPEIN